MNKTLYVGLFASFLAATGFGAFGLATAEEPDFRDGIYISEINWAGSAKSGSDEWIEITNRSGESVDFSGWMLDDAGTAGETLLIEDETVVPDGTTLLIANYKNTNEKSSLLIEPDLVTSSLSLTNSNLEISLRNANGDIIDVANLGTGAPDFGGSDPFASAIRTADGWVTADESVNLPEGQFGTPGEVDMIAETVQEDESHEACPTLEELLAEQVGSDNEVDENESEGVATSGEEAQDADLDNEVVNDDSNLNSEADTGGESTNDDGVVCTCAQEESVDVSENAVENDAGDNYLEDVDTENLPEENDANEVYATGDQSNIIINEFVSNPVEGGSEWVELYNTGDEPVSLEGMYLVDASGRKTVLEGLVSAGGFAVIESPKGQLNNGGDLVELRGVNNDVIDSVTYGEDLPAPKAGESLALQNGSFFLTKTLTPGGENVITYDSNNTDSNSQNVATSENSSDSEDSEESGQEVSETTSTEDELLSDDGQDVETEDTGLIEINSHVTVPPGVLGKQIMYVDGYQVYMHSADWPTLEVGQGVRIKGEAYEARGEMRLKISSKNDIEITGQNSLSYLNLNESPVSEWKHGANVKVEGLIANRDSDRFTLIFNDSSVEVVISSRTDLKVSSMLTDYASVAGVLRLVEDSWRVYPFESDHLKSLEHLTVDQNGENNSDYTDEDPLIGQGNRGQDIPIAGIGLFTGSVGALGYWFTKSLIS